MTTIQIIILSILFIFIMRNDILLITKYRYTFTEEEDTHLAYKNYLKNIDNE